MSSGNERQESLKGDFIAAREALAGLEERDETALDLLEQVIGSIDPEGAQESARQYADQIIDAVGGFPVSRGP